MAGTFKDRMGEIKLKVGEGHIKARCVVDQAYAQIQHQNTAYRHPHGGGPFYLSRPLMEGYPEMMQEIASTILDDPEPAFISAAEKMSRYVEENAPVAIDELRTSGHPIAERDGVPFYDRPPISPRRPEGVPHL